MMRKKPSYLAALDIGTATTTVVIADTAADGTVSLIGVGSHPSSGLRKGVVINIEATVESIKAALSQAEAMAGVQVSSVFASISGNHIEGLNSHGIVGVRGKEVSQYDLDKVIDAAKAVAIPMDREILHVLPQEFRIDEQDGIREPIGMSGVRLEGRVHLITGAVSSAENIVKCANRAGLEVKDVVVAPLASAEAVLFEDEKELGCCLIDIGAGTTDIVVIKQGAVHLTTVLAVGGNHITSDISVGVRTPVQAAEEIKIEYGSCLPKEISESETLHVSLTGGRETKLLSRAALADIIEPRVSEILQIAGGELVRAGFYDALPSGIILTGGSSRLHGIKQLAEKVFSAPVRIASPGEGVGGLTDLVALPEYSTAVGLILSGSKFSAGLSSRHQRSSFKGAFNKVANWFSEYF